MSVIMPHKSPLLFLIFSALALSVLAGCGHFTKSGAGPSLRQLSSGKMNSYEWADDMGYEGLEQAAAQSMRYYRKLPPDTTFRYGDNTYTPDEMAASVDLFMKTVRDFQGAERLRQLREKFIFFESRDADGGAFFTGYYEPVLAGSPVPVDEFNEPLYGIPDDIIEVDLKKFNVNAGSEKIVGRLEGKYLVPYYSREEIVYGRSLEEKARPIAYVNGIELFFLQIQGSGMIRLPDGSLKRVNYAMSNGYPYRSIGNILTEHIPPREMSLQSIKKYLYDNPGEAREILNYNQSYTFFREVEDGPLGNIEVPLTPDRSIAMDSRIVPRGGLAFIETELPVFDNGRITGRRHVKRFVLVQDTGGAIRGHGRVDIFFGHDDKAELLAGHLKERGRVFLIVARKEFLKSMTVQKRDN